MPKNMGYGPDYNHGTRKPFGKSKSKKPTSMGQMSGQSGKGYSSNTTSQKSAGPGTRSSTKPSSNQPYSNVDSY